MLFNLSVNVAPNRRGARQLLVLVVAAITADGTLDHNFCFSVGSHRQEREWVPLS